MKEEKKKVELNDLKKEIPYKWRVQSYSKKKPIATCVAYIDSRDAQDLLDDVCGPENWQCKYYEVKGNVYCAVGILINEWIWKSDCGIESKEDGKKGEASDAFKRACVKWGIGRFLYSLDIKYLETNEVKTGSNYPFIIDSNKKKVWDITKHINLNKKEPKKEVQDESKKTKLDEKGFVYLMTQGTEKDLNNALKFRDMTPDQKTEIENMLTVILANKK